MHGIWQDNTNLVTAPELTWPLDTACQLLQDCAFSLLHISFSPSVQICTGGGLARPLHMQVSKLEVKLWHCFPIGIPPQLQEWLS